MTITELEALEDELDLELYEKAMAEYRNNPVTYSHKVAAKMLDHD